MGSDAAEVPPKREGTLASLPELSEGDRVRVETDPQYDPERTLTVEEVGSDVTFPDLLAFRTDDDPGYVLSGYGTEYHLVVGGNKNWRRVSLLYKSQPTGVTVADLEVVERAE